MTPILILCGAAAVLGLVAWWLVRWGAKAERAAVDWIYTLALSSLVVAVCCGLAGVAKFVQHSGIPLSAVLLVMAAGLVVFFFSMALVADWPRIRAERQKTRVTGISAKRRAEIDEARARWVEAKPEAVPIASRVAAPEYRPGMWK